MYTGGMKKVLSLTLILLLLVGCAPRPAQTEFVQLTDPPATAAPTEAPMPLQSVTRITGSPEAAMAGGIS